MPNSISELISNVQIKKEEFERDIKEKAKKLRLKDLISYINLQEEFARKFAFSKNFKFYYGETISFRISHYFDADLSPTSFLIRYKNIRLAEFDSEKVKRLYNSLEKKIQREIERDLEDMPF